MFFLLHLAVFIAVIQGVFSLKCYSYVPGADNTMMIGILDSSATPGECIESPCVCASYMFQCSSDNNACSAQQITSQAIIWDYVLTTNATCQQLNSAVMAMNLTCLFYRSVQQAGNKCHLNDDYHHDNH